MKGKIMLSFFWRKPKGFTSTFCILYSIFILSACYEPEEGCLDIRATNFQADADRQCPDWCNYPQISLDFRHRVIKNDTFFNLVYLDSVYIDDFGNPYRIKNIQFYVSNFHLIRPDGREELVQDSLELEVFPSENETRMATVEDNFALVNRNIFTDYTLGTYVVDGNFVAMRFAVGIEGEARQANPNSVSEDHPLHTKKGMYVDVDSGYVFNRIEFFRDTTAADTIPTVVNIALEENLRVITIPAIFSLIEGFDIQVILQIDYLTWFQGIDMKNDPKEVVANKIVENIAQSFSVIAVELN